MCTPSLCNYRCVIYRYQHCENCKHCNSVVFESYCWVIIELIPSYYICRISKSKMNKVSATVDNNQPFPLLWCLFPHLRLKKIILRLHWVCQQWSHLIKIKAIKTYVSYITLASFAVQFILCASRFLGLLSKNSLIKLM